MIRKTTALAIGMCGFLESGALGFSSDGSSLTRTLDRTLAVTNTPILVTVNFTNGQSDAIRGFYYAEQIPYGISVTTVGVVLSGQAVTNYTSESGQDGDVFAGCTPYRWRLESPTNFAEVNPIPPQGTVQITFALSSASPGSFSLQEYSWAGHGPNDLDESFGYGEAADQQTIRFVKGIVSVTANDQSRAFGAANAPLNVSYAGFAAGDDTNVLSGSPELSTTARTDSPPGTYPITVGPGTLSADDYGFEFNSGAVTITWPVLVITSFQVVDGVVTITWPAVAGQTYRVQYKDNLTDANWTDLPPDVTATETRASKADLLGDRPQRLYRVIVVQPQTTSSPVIKSLQNAGGVITVLWSSLSGRTYRAQFKNDLGSGSWTDLPLDVTATGPAAATTDVVGNLPQRFYRVRLLE